MFKQVKQMHLVPSRIEIAIKAFCITQKEEKLKRDKVKGMYNINKAYYEVEMKVREAIKRM